MERTHCPRTAEVSASSLFGGSRLCPLSRFTRWAFDGRFTSVSLSLGCVARHADLALSRAVPGHRLFLGMHVFSLDVRLATISPTSRGQLPAHPHLLLPPSPSELVEQAARRQIHLMVEHEHGKAHLPLPVFLRNFCASITDLLCTYRCTYG